MGYSITPSEDGLYITIVEEGDYTREQAVGHTVEAHALGARLGIRCYLMDVTNARNVESVLTNYEVANREIKEEPKIDKWACVAVLVDPEDTSHDFYEVVAANAGLDLTFFRGDREAAIEHLHRNAARVNRPDTSAS